MKKDKDNGIEPGQDVEVQHAQPWMACSHLADALMDTDTEQDVIDALFMYAIVNDTATALKTLLWYRATFPDSSAQFLRLMTELAKIMPDVFDHNVWTVPVFGDMRDLEVIAEDPTVAGSAKALLSHIKKTKRLPSKVALSVDPQPGIAVVLLLKNHPALDNVVVD